jgi:hypothetical protein
MSFNSLSDLRKARGSFDNLMKEVEKIDSPQQNYNKDDGNEWKLQVDSAGNGYAVLRFLAPPKGEELPWVRLWNHGFQGPTGKWYIENSLTTLSQPDPVSELNSELWNSGTEANKDVARKQKRRLSYYANVLVVKDPANPANEGQVFLYKFGKKIFDKIKDVMQPEFEDETPVNPFDFWEGVNFKLKARQVDGYRNYDKSEFESSPTPVAESDEDIEAIWGKQHSLAELVDPKNFKTYDELKAKLNQVLSGGAKVTTAETISAQTGTDDIEDLVAVTAATSDTVTVSSSVDSDDDEDTLSYFAKLAEED